MDRHLHADPRESHSRALMVFVLFVCLFLFRLIHRHRVRGLANLPIRGAFILAPNHQSYYDPPLVTYPLFPRRVFYLAWVALFRSPRFAWWIRRLGAIELDMHRGTDKAAYATTLRLLNEGEIICVFPEGERTYDGSMLPLRPGVARLALAAGVPIVPVTIRGAFSAWPRSSRFPRLFVRIETTYHPPIRPDVSTGKDDRRKEIERILEQLARCYSGGERASTGISSIPR